MSVEGGDFAARLEALLAEARTSGALAGLRGALEAAAREAAEPARATVRFEHIGSKQLLLQYAHLRVVGRGAGR